MIDQIFSDAWHSVSELRLELAPDARYLKQWYRGEKWYVLEDRYGSRFFRVTPEAFAFLNQLRPEQTVGDYWQQSLLEDSETTPTQEEVVQLLSQLQMFNLLRVQNRSQTTDVFERIQQQRSREIRSKMASFLYVQIPLWNPEPWLKSVPKLPGLIFNRFTLVLWLILGGLAGQAVLGNLAAFKDQVQGVLSVSQIPYLYLSIVGLKLLHELGHALMTKRFGGTVTTMGVMLLIFTPMPYMDASSSWAFREKRQRILVGAAGMLIELACAFVAAVVWANTGDGALHATAFNIMLMGSISSLFFNGNPLLKFDSYYMLSDWLEIPNLYERSRLQWRSWMERYAFGAGSRAFDTGADGLEQGWLALYGALSLGYRILVTLSIALFVADQWFLLGVVLIVMATYTWVLKPMVTYGKYLWNDVALRQVRTRAISLTVVAGTAVVAGVFFLPFERAVRAPGVLLAKERATLYSAVDGTLTGLPTDTGSWVEADETVAEIVSVDLEFDLQQVDAQLDELEALVTLAIQTRSSQIDALRERQNSLRERREALRRRLGEATVRSPVSGVVITQELFRLRDTEVEMRQALMTIVNPAEFEFVAVVSQDAAYDLFYYGALEGEIKLNGRADPEGVETIESFFKVVAQVPVRGPAEESLYFHNKRGQLRIALESEPLGVQVWRNFRQLLQRRYRL